ncbi:hypothetical protein BKA70DRAFT_1568161 [Coprinopsis sp. MPI-PUGE-AT-0042]|nr:hypothetical protein BKA70DRAFT_1568161 [Coprinopsis sp. MPI-PUGE-AT-0042]
MDGPADSPIVVWQPSAMSAILDSPNILRIICTSLTTRKDVLNMALLCKASSSIALDEIWRSRRSMAQLLAPLYCDGFISMLTPTFSLCRVLTKQDSAWVRLCQYASRIKAVTANEDFFGNLAHGMVLRLMQLSGDQPIFPHLRRLDLSVSEGGAVVSDLPFFLSPTLHHVAIDIDSAANRDADTSIPFVQSFLFMTQEQGIPLDHLSLLAKIPVHISSFSSFFSTLSGCKDLRTLHLERVRCLDADETRWISDLGLLKGLEELRLVAEDNTSISVRALRPPSAYMPTAGQESSNSQSEAITTPGPPEPKAVLRYPSLNKLYLQAPARVVDALLSCVSSDVLGELTLWLQATRQVKTVAELCGCFVKLGLQASLHGSLKRFTFEANIPPRIPSSYLMPLQKMSKLEYLEITNNIFETDQFIEAVIAQLPCLTEFLIPLSSAPASITVFHTFSASCPNLTWLQIPLDTCSDFPVFDDLLHPPKKHRLQHLTLSDWSGVPTQRQLFLAVRHLNASFPYLRVLNRHDMYDNWQTVLIMLGTLRDIAWSG